MITDIHIKDLEVYFLPVKTRIPLKFGTEVLTSVTCVRIKVTVENNSGQYNDGWGETPLSVQWVWPSSVSYSIRFMRLKKFVLELAHELKNFSVRGHPLETGYLFQKEILP